MAAVLTEYFILVVSVCHKKNQGLARNFEHVLVWIKYKQEREASGALRVLPHQIYNVKDSLKWYYFELSNDKTCS